MTPDRDTERLLESWFAEGPTQMPSQLMDTLTERIGRVTQRRLMRLPSRAFRVSLGVRLATAVVALVGVVAVGTAWVVNSPGVGVAPSGSPLRSPAESSGTAVDPSAIQSHWVPIGTRRLPRPTDSGSRSDVLVGDMNIGATAIAISSYKGDNGNGYSWIGPNSIRLVLQNADGWACQPGDVGTYTVELSADQGTLALGVIEDSCADRAYVLTDDWARSTVGVLDAGQHVSWIFKPYGIGGRFGYSVPAGWQALEDCGSCYVIAMQGADPAQIRLTPDILVSDNGATCSDPTVHLVEPSAEQLAAWLATVPGLTVTSPSPVAIGGMTGVTVDVSLPTGWESPCSYTQDPGPPAGPRVYDTFVNTFEDAASEALGPIAAGGRTKYLLLDHGVGQTMLIELDVPDPGTWDAFVAEAMPIIDTFVFTR